MKIRVCELARDLNMTNQALLDNLRDLLDNLRSMNIDEKSVISSLDEETVEMVRNFLSETLNEKPTGKPEKEGLSMPPVEENRDDLPVNISLSFKLTNTAVRKIMTILGEIDEFESEPSINRAYQMLRDILGEGVPLACCLRKGRGGKEGELSVDLITASNNRESFDRTTLDKLKGKAICFTGIEMRDTSSIFLIIDVKTLPGHAARPNAFCISIPVKFYYRNTYSYIPDCGLSQAIQKKLTTLPTSREYELSVEKQLIDWRRWLDIREKIAKTKQFELKYSMYKKVRDNRFLDFSVVSTCDQGTVDWDKVKRAIDQQVQWKSVDATSEEQEEFSVSLALGTIANVSEQKHTVSIRLSEEIQERLDNINTLLPPEGILSYTPGGDLREIENQRKGLDRLKKHNVQHPRLGDFLFDASEAALPKEEDSRSFQQEELLIPFLNDLQQEAVEKALICPDLSLIKGPPGTGKTTVIAEICYQIAKQGKRILISSQSNLAIDNALTKLIHEPSIRALRVGLEAKIEEEGKPYMESKIIATWLDNTKKHCTEHWEQLEKRVKDVEAIYPLIEYLDEYMEHVESQKNLENDFKQEMEKRAGVAKELVRQQQELEKIIKEADAHVGAIGLMLDRLYQRENLNGIDREEIDGLEMVCADPRYSDYVKSIDQIQKPLYFLGDMEKSDKEWRDAGSGGHVFLL
jgi:hypothetical protein